MMTAFPSEFGGFSNIVESAAFGQERVEHGRANRESGLNLMQVNSE
jgi:hypothetical protein